MRALRSFAVAVVAVVVLAAPAVVLADGRVALVVGNSTYYAHIGRLPNADNDAADMSAALRRLGFEVTTELDADRAELTEALRAFTRRSLGDVALVFYAGHGIEMDRVNYLVPVDARLERDLDLRYEAVTLDDMLASTQRTRTLAGRSVSRGSFADLNEDLLGDETLVAYAAAGTTAADGRGRNSPYTAALLAHLEQPLEIGLLFRRVRAQVLASTNGQQRPHQYQSQVGEHYLSVPATAEAVTVAAAAPCRLARGRDSPAGRGRCGGWRPAYRPAPPARRAGQRKRAERAWREVRGRPRRRCPGLPGGRVLVPPGGDEEAVRWFRRAAEQGNVLALYSLGLRYEQGRGVPRNRVEAAKWYSLAADQGLKRPER